MTLSAAGASRPDLDVYKRQEDIRPNGESPGKVDFSGVREMARDGAALLTLIGITVYGAGYGVFVTALPRCV